MGLDQYQDFDFEWSYLQEVLKDIHQFSFKGYSQDLQLNRFSAKDDGGVPIINFLYKFITGYEIERVLRDQIKVEEFFKVQAWFLFKIVFKEAFTLFVRKKEAEDEEYKYEHPVEIFLSEKFHPSQIKNDDYYQKKNRRFFGKETRQV